jgi:hypothetical protein
VLIFSSAREKPRAEETQPLLRSNVRGKVMYQREELGGMLRSSWDFGVTIKNTGYTSLRDAIADGRARLTPHGSRALVSANRSVNCRCATPGGAEWDGLPIHAEAGSLDAEPQARNLAAPAPRHGPVECREGVVE